MKNWTFLSLLLYSISSPLFILEMLMKEGGRSLDELFDSACIRLAKYMREVGLVPSHIDDVINLTRVSVKDTILYS